MQYFTMQLFSKRLSGTTQCCICIITHYSIIMLLLFDYTQAGKYFVSEMQLYRHFTKPPPPYGSTPDLSNERRNNVVVSASSPDLHIPNQQRRQHKPLPTVESYCEDQEQEIPPSQVGYTDDYVN